MSLAGGDEAENGSRRGSKRQVQENGKAGVETSKRKRELSPIKGEEMPTSKNAQNLQQSSSTTSSSFLHGTVASHAAMSLLSNVTLHYHQKRVGA